MDLAVGMPRGTRLWCSTMSSKSDQRKNEDGDEKIDGFLGSQHDFELQVVDPKRGWSFRGVHKVLNANI